MRPVEALVPRGRPQVQHCVVDDAHGDGLLDCGTVASGDFVHGGDGGGLRPADTGPSPWVAYNTGTATMLLAAKGQVYLSVQRSKVSSGRGERIGERGCNYFLYQ